jgi:hypothetical protein
MRPWLCGLDRYGSHRDESSGAPQRVGVTAVSSLMAVTTGPLGVFSAPVNPATAGGKPPQARPGEPSLRTKAVAG